MAIETLCVFKPQTLLRELGKTWISEENGAQSCSIFLFRGGMQWLTCHTDICGLIFFVPFSPSYLNFLSSIYACFRILFKKQQQKKNSIREQPLYKGHTA